ncbi:MAG: hypothetical protein DRN81_03245 [Thermoproteota archaeon]|nr:MAG: hypothetical protein DRN81_03245 [Candidatus Korarchaeota archaeon]
MASKFTFSVKKSAEKLKKNLDSLSPLLEKELNQAVGDVAAATYAEITATAQSDLSKTRQDYLKGLSFNKLGENAFLITLDGEWANMLEEGFPSYNLTEKLLKSNKTVEVGRRSGMPWVQDSKGEEDPHKYAYVPFQRQPMSKDPKVKDMGDAIKEMMAVNAQGRNQKLTSVFKDTGGNPLEGKVATAKSDNPLVDGLVKYQKTYQNEKTGKNTTQSIYMNYRCISDGQDVSPWIHPGFSGLNAFDKASKNVEKHLETIIKHFFK